MEELTPTNDGITHINVYSKGKTNLGRMLSNFSITPFNHPEHGWFKSIEGYWHWAATGMQHDELRVSYGINALRLGRSLPKVYREDFPQLIKRAINLKLEQNPQLLADLVNCKLPLTHYYWWGSEEKLRLCKPIKHSWFIKYLEELRLKLNQEHNDVIIS